MQWMQGVAWGLALLIVTGSARLTLAEGPAHVGEFGDYRRLSVTGNESFTAESIQWALACNFDVALAGHPLAPLADYLAMLERRCRDGYLEHGFLHATAKAKLDERSGKIVITVDEGPQFLAGGIEIIGTQRIDPVGLHELLLASVAPPAALPSSASDEDSDDDKDQEPLWRRDQPVNFSALGGKQREQRVQAALAAMGFHQAVCDVQLVRHGDSLQATLQIKLLDEGEPAFAKDVAITGLERNTRDALLQEIEWRDDRLMTSTELDRIEQRLYQSGRFIRHSVRLAPPDVAQGRYRLLIDVLEYPRVTPLGRPLTEVEEVLRKHAVWFNDWQQRDVDLVAKLTHRGNRYSIILSPQRGMLLERRGLAADAPATTLVFAADHFACYPANGAQRFAMPNLGRGISLTGQSVLNDKPNRDKEPFHFKFSLQFTSSVSEGKLPVAIDLVATPAQCLAVAYAHNAKCTLADGVLTIESEFAVRQFAAASGQLLQYTIKEGQIGDACEVAFVAGAFADELAQVRKASANQANAYDAEHPFRSFARFAFSEPVLRDMLSIAGKEVPQGKPILEPPLRSALEKIIRSAAFDGWKQPPREAATDMTERFSIAHTGLPGDDSVTQYARFLLPGADIAFPRNSWPATLWRESCLMLAKRPLYFRQELDRLHAAPETGPVCSLTTASLLNFVSPEAAGPFARQGLGRLSVADFRNDYEPLLDDQSPVGIAANGLLDSLRDFDDAERAALGRLLIGKHAEEFVAATRLMHENPDRPASELLPPVLDLWWEVGLRDRVEAALRVYASE